MDMFGFGTKATAAFSAPEQVGRELTESQRLRQTMIEDMRKMGLTAPPESVSDDGVARAYAATHGAIGSKPTSIVGSVVITLDKARKTYITRRDALQAEITAKTEELRQTTAALQAIETGMIELGGDVALTEGELALIDDLVPTETIDQAELQLDEPVTFTRGAAEFVS